MTALSS